MNSRMGLELFVNIFWAEMGFKKILINKKSLQNVLRTDSSKSMRQFREQSIIAEHHTKDIVIPTCTFWDKVAAR